MDVSENPVREFLRIDGTSYFQAKMLSETNHTFPPGWGKVGVGGGLVVSGNLDGVVVEGIGWVGDGSKTKWALGCGIRGVG